MRCLQKKRKLTINEENRGRKRVVERQTETGGVTILAKLRGPNTLDTTVDTPCLTLMFHCRLAVDRSINTKALPFALCPSIF